MKKQNLRQILTLNFVLSAMLPFAAFGIITIVISKSYMEKEFTSRNFMIAKSLSGEIQEFLDQPLSVLDYVEAEISGDSTISGADITSFLEGLIKQFSYFTMIQILNDRGCVTHIAPFNEHYIGNDRSNNPYFEVTLKTKKPYWSSTFISSRTGKPTIALGKPIKDGVISGYLDLHALNEIIDKIKIGSNGYAAICDQDGTTIAHPNRVFVSERWNVKNLNVIQEGLAGKEGTFRYHFMGEEKIGSVAIVPQTGWLIIVIQPVEEAFAPVKKIRNLIAGGTITAIILAIIIALATLKKTLKPFLTLAANAKRISDGKYELSPQQESYKEVDELANDLDVMVEAIKTREMELRASKEKYRTLFENATDAIFIAQDEVLKFANPKTEDITEYPQEELAKVPFLDLIHPEDRDMVLENHIKRLKGQEVPSIYSFRVINRSGEELSVELSVVVIDWEGRPATLNFMRDITVQKKLEAQLQQALKMEAMGTLAGGIAHDFNNLLMAIQGRTSIMLMKKDSSHPDIRHLKGIEDNVESAADLTRQLLGFARGGKYEVKPTDLNELIKKQNRMFGRTKKEISIRGKYEENLWPVEIDQGQIDQVLLNLYVNAWQAMPAGGDLYLKTENVTLDEIDVEPFSIEPGEYVKISVTDTGVGMDKATREKIFEPFFTTKEMGRGTGLGLASAYGIIKNHGGFINVYSEKGHGTTFNIYLPASEKEVTEEKKSAGEILRGSETVLFVDDEDMIIEIAEEMFEQLGYKVLTARSGKEAIEIYMKNKEQIDIVLLDMIMPEMSGSDTYDSLKEINPDIKVLLSSGYSINGQATEIMDRGCNGFIQKPFKMKELSQKLREILDKK